MENREKIIKRLQEHWNYILSLGYNEDRMLGIFAYGSMNYGFYNPETSDIDSKIIILPSFEDMCFKKDWFSHEYKYEGEHIEVKDIRMMREMFMKQNVNYIEILYSEFFILNPKYAELFNTYFINNREYISHYDRKQTMKSISGQLLHTLKQYPIDNKKLYNADRLTIFLEKYLSGMNYIECLQPKNKEHEFLWNLKYGKLAMCSNNEYKETYAKQLSGRIKYLNNEYAEIDSPHSKTALTAMDAGVTEILKFSFKDHEPKSPRKEDFFKQLTNAETKAYYSIIKEIGCEGNITISKLVERNNISRPVYNNLIAKMKENKVATITNMGMKGTYIKITQFELKAESIDFNKKL